MRDLAGVGGGSVEDERLGGSGRWVGGGRETWREWEVGRWRTRDLAGVGGGSVEVAGVGGGRETWREWGVGRWRTRDLAGVAGGSVEDESDGWGSGDGSETGTVTEEGPPGNRSLQ